MNIKQIIEYLNNTYPDIDKNPDISSTMIEEKEKELGFVLPESYKYFINNFSNGICLLDAESIGGVSESAPCGMIDFSNKIVESNSMVYLPNNYAIEKDKLFALTIHSVPEASNDHWAFICNKNYENNEYPIGLVSDSTKNIIHVVENFEEWLTILIEGDKKDMDTSVINIIYPDWDEKCDILAGDKKSYKPMYSVTD